MLLQVALPYPHHWRCLLGVCIRAQLCLACGETLPCAVQSVTHAHLLATLLLPGHAQECDCARAIRAAYLVHRVALFISLHQHAARLEGK